MNAKWITCQKDIVTPRFSKTFTAEKIASAVIDISGLGYFTLLINGKKVSDDLFTPAQTNYAPRDLSKFIYPIFDTIGCRVLYMTYDVKDYLVEGENTIDVIVGNGWFRQKESDVDSRHIYFGPWSGLKVSDKPLVLSEFGGYAYPVKDHVFNTGNIYGYKVCKNREQFQEAVNKLYLEKVVPAAKKGLCAAIITQVSDVEDEINGFLTYDRKVNKADAQQMLAIASLLKEALSL